METGEEKRGSAGEHGGNGKEAGGATERSGERGGGARSPGASAV